METISTSSVSIMFITLTSHWTQAGGYFWNSFVDKLTPHPAFTNSSWWSEIQSMRYICCYAGRTIGEYFWISQAKQLAISALRTDPVGPLCHSFIGKTLLRLDHRHVKHKFYDDIQSCNVTISLKSLWYKWVVSLVAKWIWHTMEIQ